MVDQRLDSALAERGLARSRTHAQSLIADGLVTVDGFGAAKASARVGEDARVAVAASDHYVSRAAHKLIAALDAFGVTVADRVALDAGASTGGFSQVLLERGARRVLAVDVGHGQLAPQVAGNERLVLAEGVNVRHLSPEMLAGATGVPDRPDLVTADLSFISLITVLPALRETATDDADFVLLIKPQFEVGRGGIRDGIVHDPDRRADAITGVLWAAWDLGLGTAGLLASPVIGSAGNREYLVGLSSRAGQNPTEWVRCAQQLAHQTDRG